MFSYSSCLQKCFCNGNNCLLQSEMHCVTNDSFRHGTIGIVDKLHYNDVMMSAVASESELVHANSMQTSKLLNPPVTGRLHLWKTLWNDKPNCDLRRHDAYHWYHCDVFGIKSSPYHYSILATLTHWGWVTHICVSRLIIISSDNGLSPDRR